MSDELKMIKETPLFSEWWYGKENADVFKSNVDRADHYLRFGGREGRRSHPFFDAGYYIIRYPDLKSASYHPLVHFLDFGWQEGRIPSPLMEKLLLPSSRPMELLKSFEASAQELTELVQSKMPVAFIMKAGLSGNFDEADKYLVKISGQSHVTTPVTRERYPWLQQPDTVAIRTLVSNLFLSEGNGIEIGALHNPLPVVSGLAIKYVDRQSNEELREHYPELNNLPLVPVDIVSNGETLDTIPDETQDFVIGNHFLEHCQNPLMTLGNFLRVLRPGGVAYIALPDQRVTFDKDREITTLEHLVRDYREGASWSRAHHFYEWAKLVEPHFGRQYEGEELQKRTQALMKQDYSIHYHTWVPHTFFTMLQYSREALNFKMDIEFFMSCPEEMIVILRKTML